MAFLDLVYVASAFADQGLDTAFLVTIVGRRNFGLLVRVWATLSGLLEKPVGLRIWHHEVCPRKFVVD